MILESRVRVGRIACRVIGVPGSAKARADLEQGEVRAPVARAELHPEAPAAVRRRVGERDARRGELEALRRKRERDQRKEHQRAGGAAHGGGGCERSRGGSPRITLAPAVASPLRERLLDLRQHRRRHRPGASAPVGDLHPIDEDAQLEHVTARLGHRDVRSVPQSCRHTGGYQVAPRSNRAVTDLDGMHDQRAGTEARVAAGAPRMNAM